MRKRLTLLATLALAVLLVAVSLLPPAANPASQAAGPLLAPAAPGPSLLDGLQGAAMGGALGAAPEQLIAGQNPGVYYLDYGSTVLDPNVYPIKGSLRFFGWSTLQSGPGAYNWGNLDGLINARYSSGLSTGVFISTYDGPLDGDIRVTPDFVIQTANTMIVTPEYVNYYQYSQNGDFETSTAYHGHAYAWDRAGNANAVVAPGGSWAAFLGGTNNAADSLTHWNMHIPA